MAGHSFHKWYNQVSEVSSWLEVDDPNYHNGITIGKGLPTISFLRLCIADIVNSV